jgi:hypothetical protein
LTAYVHAVDQCLTLSSRLQTNGRLIFARNTTQPRNCISPGLLQNLPGRLK